MAIGTFTGALLAAGWKKPCFRILLRSAAMLGTGFALATVTPDPLLFGAALVLIGVSTLTFTTTMSSLMQLSTTPSMRGRVMALRVATGVGATPVGAPIIGWIADVFGPQWALGVCAASGFAAALIAISHLRNTRTK